MAAKKKKAAKKPAKSSAKAANRQRFLDMIAKKKGKK